MLKIESAHLCIRRAFARERKLQAELEDTRRELSAANATIKRLKKKENSHGEEGQ